ncbi:uncharacterized protein MONBRDRAFT_32377 [Monosiga brevicollis MX1]|uniref:GAIN-B domain-containing protein n=1 Tax=Monosiga brevicollis TaxID=81824 RepID=A9UZ52_MONBE|nr:uncharacterized protein MONBRDRAFT_32377 [Monosiga brevicollis MX1]EDQ89573.1 predicted protein [Monosiga brevicollis MX1]|eukprot:XP_001745602.1 hypothetical protein [Monosiga brevicollis MX1]
MAVEAMAPATKGLSQRQRGVGWPTCAFVLLGLALVAQPMAAFTISSAVSSPTGPAVNASLLVTPAVLNASLDNLTHTLPVRLVVEGPPAWRLQNLTAQFATTSPLALGGPMPALTAALPATTAQLSSQTATLAQADVNASSLSLDCNLTVSVAAANAIHGVVALPLTVTLSFSALELDNNQSSYPISYTTMLALPAAHPLLLQGPDPLFGTLMTTPCEYAAVVSAMAEVDFSTCAIPLSSVALPTPVSTIMTVLQGWLGGQNPQYQPLDRALNALKIALEDLQMVLTTTESILDCATTQVLTTLADDIIRISHAQEAEALASWTSLVTPQCGNGVCNLTAESCQTCLSDCGTCLFAFVPSSSNQQVPNLRSLVGAWEPSSKLGAVRISPSVFAPLASESRLSFDVLDVDNFAGYKLTYDARIDSGSDEYPYLHTPTADYADTLCFAGLSFAFTASGPVDDLRFVLDLSGAFMFRDAGVVLPVVASWNETSQAWEALANQSHDALAQTLTFHTTQSAQYALYAQPFVAPTTTTTAATTVATSIDSTATSDATTTINPALANALADLMPGTNSSERVSTTRFSNTLLNALDAILDSIVETLPEGGVAVLSHNGVSIKAENRPSNATSNYTASGVQPFPAVGLPPDFAAVLAQLGVTAGDSVNLLLTSFEGQNPNASGIMDFTIKLGQDNLEVHNLSEPILISFYVDSDVNASDESVECRFWNATLLQANCTPSDTYDCLGAWDATGVRKVPELSHDNYVVCETVHLSTFGVGVDFTITPPDVSLANFNPANAKYIWVLWGSFYGFCGLIYLYAFFEKRAYDRRQAMIDAGLLWADELGPREKSDAEIDLELVNHGFLGGWARRFAHMIKRKHQWCAIVWPSGKSVYPKRSVIVTAFMSTTSLAFGMMAIFCYTESQNPGENTNTFRVTVSGSDVYLPLEGIYSFFITFPFMVILSISLAKYSCYLDLLRKICPARYRNHAAVAKLRPKMQGMYLGLDEAYPPGSLQLGRQMSRKSSETVMTELDLAMFEEVEMESRDPLHGAQPSAAIDDQAPFKVMRLSLDDEKNVDQQDDEGVLAMLNKEDELERAAGDGTREQKLLRSFADELNIAFDFQDSISQTDSGLAAEDQVEYDEAEIAHFDRLMRFYRTTSYGLAYFLLITGLVLALTFMGSMDEEVQVRYLKGVGEFLIFSAIITAPLVFLVASGQRQMYMMRERQRCTDAEWQSRVAMATAIGTALIMTRAMIQREIGRAIRESFGLSIL